MPDEVVGARAYLTMRSLVTISIAYLALSLSKGRCAGSGGEFARPFDVAQGEVYWDGAGK
jgi:hypothetical protein